MKYIISQLFIYLIVFPIMLFAQATPKYEVRGVWLATVANIDWPWSNELTSGEQIAELIEIFDELQESKINTVYFQVRTECDALYESSFEPWSFWLTGEQGKEPYPFFDPLEFAIDEAHERGMELHAWLNPYRAVKEVGEYKIADSHVTNLRPDWILDFGKYKMLNPGIPEVTDYIVNVVADIVQRYDIDGIHFDDYFYPYVPKITGEDAKTFSKYKNGFNNVDDWRRNNINNMIAEVHKAINEINPNVKFGVSPFGIVENKYAGTSGFNSYSEIYCDPLTWLKNNTVDYVVPQLYWETGHEAADYNKLLPWWNSVIEDRGLLAGLYSSKMMNESWKGSFAEIGNQVRLSREYDNVRGIVFFSAKSVFDNYSGFKDTLSSILFEYPALIPAMKWKDSIPPSPPTGLKMTGDVYFRELTWESPEAADDGDTSAGFVVYRFSQTEEENLNRPENIIHISYKPQNSFTDKDILIPGVEYTYIITSLDEIKNESKGFSKFIFGGKKNR